MTRVHFPLTPDNEPKKVFRDIPIRLSQSQKFKRYPCESKNTSIVGAALVKDLDVKFANIWYLLKVLHHLQNAHEFRPENLNCRSKNVVYLISCKTCHKQYTGRSEEFKTRFIIIGVRIITIIKTGKLNKSHFMLIVQMIFIVVKVTGK